MKILVLGHFGDNQSALYIMDSCRQIASDVAGIDVRQIVLDLGAEQGQKVIMQEVEKLKIIPDLIIVLKGIEINHDTLLKIKAFYPAAKIVNWFFDKYLTIKPIWEETEFFDSIKVYDKFFCSLKGVADKLIEKGFTNVEHLPEGCNPNFNSDVYMNSYQENKYGEDIAFCGSIGFLKQHPSRIPILDKIVKEGYN